MSKLTAAVLPLAITLFAIAWFACNDYNVVEPRFYSTDDLAELAPTESSGWICQMVADSGGGLVVRRPAKLIPEMFQIQVGWCDNTSRSLAIACSIPVGGHTSLLLLNSGGGIDKTLVRVDIQAGYFYLVWVPEQEGVFGLVLLTDEYRFGPVWIEVDR